MGAVYLGVHSALRKQVAIKVLQPRIASSPQARARFLREGQAASRIRHDSIVDVYDVGLEGEVPYLVMEYLEGESLAVLLKRSGALSVQAAVDILVPVIAGLDAAHASGIVHRDLKPDNIFLCHGASPRPKILDFGISKVLDETSALTNSEAFLGTPCYMSPEQTKHAANVDPQADQYSVGVILYEMVCGRRPFHEESLYILLQRIVEGDFPRPRDHVPTLPENVEAIIVRAMSVDPSSRFHCLRDLGAALLQYASQETRLVFASQFARAAGGARSAAFAQGTVFPPERGRAVARWLVGTVALGVLMVLVLLAQRGAGPKASGVRVPDPSAPTGSSELQTAIPISTAVETPQAARSTVVPVNPTTSASARSLPSGRPAPPLPRRPPPKLELAPR